MRCCLFHCRLLVSFPWTSAKSPSSRQRENTTDPFSLSLFSGFFEVSMASAKLGRKKKKKLWECSSENPPLPPCHVVDFSLCFKGLALYFPVYGFTLHLHTELIHSICENHPLKQTYLLVWCSLNCAIICYRHMLHCVWDMCLVVRHSEIHHSLDPCDVIWHSEDLSWPAYARIVIVYLFQTFWFSKHTVLRCVLCVALISQL